MAGAFSWPDGGQRAGCRRQAGNGRARNRARAPLDWFSQGQRWGRCKVRRRAERVSRPVREKKRRLRVLVVTTCSPRPMRAVQRARLCAITCTASQAPLAAKRQGCELGLPRASWRIPVWAGARGDGGRHDAGRRTGASRCQRAPLAGVAAPGQIVIAGSAADEFKLVDGHHRLRAAMLATWTEKWIVTCLWNQNCLYTFSKLCVLLRA